MYFEGDPYNRTDPFLNSVGEAGRQGTIGEKTAGPVSRSRTRVKNGDLRHGAVQRIADEPIPWTLDRFWGQRRRFYAGVPAA